MLVPADFKSVPGFDNRPRFVGVIEQNKISDSYENYCISFGFSITKIFELTSKAKTKEL